jgi:glycyl-tRNA synthetase
MATSTNFQSIIMNLQEFWASKGCLIWQPYYSQVGAGTMNPATYLRVLGPEPWNVAYVEPSVRPDDGRYGENPNRLQQHYQFQVILKPDPGNPQEIYLQSLQAIGIDPAEHDIRFVEDNWESPALGAWGLGWEVWLDGQEITQFTYFQQAGGQVLEPVSVEITYGLDRIAMALQKVSNFRDIRWSNDRTAGDVNLVAEFEHSKYYFELADVDRLRQMYTLFEKEADAALAAGLVLPAHDYILKCSHTFNILDTRGAIGVTERQAFFGRMRDLARKTADLYTTQRQTMEFPWLSKSNGESQTFNAQKSISSPNFTTPQPFLFEIGTEELPVSDLDSALGQVKDLMTALLKDQRLEYSNLQVWGTPRRLVAYVEDLQPNQPDREMVVKGPPASHAFDASGKLTPAGEGFAKSKGIDPSSLKTMDIDGGQYAAVVVHEKGKPAWNVLSEELPKLLAKIKFDKTMRWNSSKIAFSRPIRWLLAILGDTLVPFSYADIPAGKSTRGLRFIQPEEIAVNTPAEYFHALKTQGIILNQAERKQVIREQVTRIMQETGADSVLPEELLDEVTNLVEAPTALRGEFERKHLDLPKEVLISVMKKHQRYFPLQSGENLLPYFVVVRNGDGQHVDIVADGNAQVIRARFADAAFFIKEDMHKKLEDFLLRLDTLTFQIKLGSMLDKTHRIEQITPVLIESLQLSDAEKKDAVRIAHLCKADLVTHMVVEMTSLQGIIGKFYALQSGESASVASGIFEHYLPRYSGDRIPQGKAGLLVGIADRLDTLSGLFAAGLAPTGTKDPFAQRRAALGLVINLMEWNLDFDLVNGLDAAAKFLPVKATPETQKACYEFILGRLRSYLLDQGYRYDIVDSALAAQGKNPAGALRTVHSLVKWTASPEWTTILPAYGRCVRITRDQKETYTVEPNLFQESSELELWQALQRVEKNAPFATFDQFIETFQTMIPAINQFFDAVMVMAEDKAIQQNRLGLLQRIAVLPASLANLSLLEGF